MKAKLFSFLILLLLSVTASSQKVIINGKEGLRRLEWRDFTGTPDAASPFHAYTKWNLNYRYRNVQFVNDSATIGTFELMLQLDPQHSWVKRGKETDALLVHEQGHFNFGIMCMKEFEKAIATTKFSATDFKTEITALFTTTLQKYQALSRQYDAETKHSNDKEGQAKWNTYFTTELAKYKL